MRYVPRGARSVSCPDCNQPMRKNPKKAEYICENPRCPVISVRVAGRRVDKVLREPTGRKTIT